MPSIFESEKMQESAKGFSSLAKNLLLVFPELEWNLKRAGYHQGAVEYLTVALSMTFFSFVGSLALLAVPLLLLPAAKIDLTLVIGAPIGIGVFSFLYSVFKPNVQLMRKAKLLDKDLEYMLKDMQIQMTAGVPLFNTMANIASGGYGECSKLIGEIVQEVESGSSMRDVLNNYGMFSPSEYMRRSLWQIANAMQTGSDIKVALVALSNDIRQEKENKIKIYGQELSLWGLIYMMMVIVMPSMGVTLLVVLSSFLGGSIISMDLLWMVLGAVILFQLLFISLIRSKRPDIE